MTQVKIKIIENGQKAKRKNNNQSSIINPNMEKLDPA
jgi:hypothetical protein